jgi:hypothetical protein
MWWIPIAGVILLALAAIWLGFIPAPHAAILLRVRKGELLIRRGQLKPHAREHVADILSEAGVANGFIAVTAGNRVMFSRQIPAAVHQRLRNVLLNQWT